jgi:hypothetical protein
MPTSHFCGGKWRPGPVADCPKHTRLSKKQKSVYRSGDDQSGKSGGGESSSSSKSD